MTQKDIQAQFKRETGVYSPFEIDYKPRPQCEYKEYAKWLEEQIIKLNESVSQMKLELNKPKERNHYA